MGWARTDEAYVGDPDLCELEALWGGEGGWFGMERWPEVARRRWLGWQAISPLCLPCCHVHWGGWMALWRWVSACRTTVSAGRGAAAVPLVLVAMRGSKEGHASPIQGCSGLRHEESSSPAQAGPPHPPEVGGEG